jgi:hypothetical protein
MAMANSDVYTVSEEYALDSRVGLDRSRNPVQTEALAASDGIGTRALSESTLRPTENSERSLEFASGQQEMTPALPLSKRMESVPFKETGGFGASQALETATTEVNQAESGGLGMVTIAVIVGAALLALAILAAVLLLKRCHGQQSDSLVVGRWI